jgi:hypothetical protein
LQVLAKQLLSGQHVVVVRCEEINISGGMVRQKAKFERFLRKRSVTNPRRGAVKFRCARLVCIVCSVEFHAWHCQHRPQPESASAFCQALRHADGVPFCYGAAGSMALAVHMGVSSAALAA